MAKDEEMDHANGANGQSGGRQNGLPTKERPRVPTLERAIQCSPFLSIMPLSQGQQVLHDRLTRSSSSFIHLHTNMIMQKLLHFLMLDLLLSLPLHSRPQNLKLSIALYIP